MQKYIKTMENRKDLVKRLEQLIGERAVYTRMPECAFVVGDYKVEKKGTLVVLDDADMEPIERLLAEGLITPEISPVTTTEEEDSSGDEENEEENSDGDEAVVSVDMNNHTVTSLRNLINMVYSRAALLSKATGGMFGCSEELVTALLEPSDLPTFLKTINDNKEDLVGIEITPTQITFTGFPNTSENNHIFCQLANLMNKMALESKRVLARRVVDENERYIFRIWLLRLGMAGKEYAKARQVLLSPLSGSAAFKDQAMEDRWKEKRRATA